MPRPAARGIVVQQRGRAAQARSLRAYLEFDAPHGPRLLGVWQASQEPGDVDRLTRILRAGALAEGLRFRLLPPGAPLLSSSL